MLKVTGEKSIFCHILEIVQYYIEFIFFYINYLEENISEPFVLKQCTIIAQQLQPLFPNITLENITQSIEPQLNCILCEVNYLLDINFQTQNDLKSQERKYGLVGRMNKITKKQQFKEFIRQNGCNYINLFLENDFDIEREFFLNEMRDNEANQAIIIPKFFKPYIQSLQEIGMPNESGLQTFNWSQHIYQIYKSFMETFLNVNPIDEVRAELRKMFNNPYIMNNQIIRRVEKTHRDEIKVFYHCLVILLENFENITNTVFNNLIHFNEKTFFQGEIDKDKLNNLWPKGTFNDGTTFLPDTLDGWTNYHTDRELPVSLGATIQTIPSCGAGEQEKEACRIKMPGTSNQYNKIFALICSALFNYNKTKKQADFKNFSILLESLKYRSIFEYFKVYENRQDITSYQQYISTIITTETTNEDNASCTYHLNWFDTQKKCKKINDKVSISDPYETKRYNCPNGGIEFKTELHGNYTCVFKLNDLEAYNMFFKLLIMDINHDFFKTKGATRTGDSRRKATGNLSAALNTEFAPEGDDPRYFITKLREFDTTDNDNGLIDFTLQSLKENVPIFEQILAEFNGNGPAANFIHQDNIFYFRNKSNHKEHIKSFLINETSPLRLSSSAIAYDTIINNSCTHMNKIIKDIYTENGNGVGSPFACFLSSQLDPMKECKSCRFFGSMQTYHEAKNLTYHFTIGYSKDKVNIETENSYTYTILYEATNPEKIKGTNVDENIMYMWRYNIKEFKFQGFCSLHNNYNFSSDYVSNDFFEKIYKGHVGSYGNLRCGLVATETLKYVTNIDLSQYSSPEFKRNILISCLHYKSFGDIQQECESLARKISFIANDRPSGLRFIYLCILLRLNIIIPHYDKPERTKPNFYCGGFHLGQHCFLIKMIDNIQQPIPLATQTDIPLATEAFQPEIGQGDYTGLLQPEIDKRYNNLIGLPLLHQNTEPFSRFDTNKQDFKFGGW